MFILPSIVFIVKIILLLNTLTFIAFYYKMIHIII